jgi:four helix bundle protein
LPGNRIKGELKPLAMTKDDLIKRSQDLVFRIVKMTESLSDEFTSDFFSEKIIRAAASIGIHLMASSRAESKKEEKERLRLSQEGIDQTLFWLELIEDCELVKPEKLVSLKEDYQVMMTMVSSLQKPPIKKRNS